MIKVTRKQWEAISNDYKGVWTTEIRNDLPENWVGKKKVLSGSISSDKGCKLLTESVHFEIV